LNTTISNSNLTAIINPLGAELISLKNSNNKEYIWEGNPEFWGKHSPILFPIVGCLKNDKYSYKGNSYTLLRHGFANKMEFNIIEKSADNVIFSVKNNKETLENYPFEFELQISYTLVNSSLKIGYKVINTNDFEMPFSIGGHPGFALPNEFDSYSLEFEKSEILICSQLENDLICNDTISLPMKENRLPLSYSLFENDALIFKKLESKAITISENNVPFLKVKFEGFPSLGIWTKQKAPYICIEPWFGYADTMKNSGELSEKEGIQIIGINEQFQSEYSIEIL
jgi:galactose mutarotase-like enzyme